ncbi:MAG: glycosyltransferase [Tannerellaceae bacterium]
MGKVLIVNATAASTSGAATILKQFLDYAANRSDLIIYIFISPYIELEVLSSHIHLIRIKNVKSYLMRLYWDYIGLSRYLRKHNIIPTCSLSLQNTNFNTGYKIPNYIYYHQAIPFYDYKWCFFKKSERVLFFYKNIYPIFVSLSLNKCSVFFVQLEYIKQGVKCLFNVPSSNIYIIKPTFEPLALKENFASSLFLDNRTINFFYPATDAFYKNHQLLYDLFNQFDEDEYALYLTMSRPVNNLTANIHCVNLLTVDEMNWMYNNVDVLLYPSYIESFGLPLLEAAYFGLPIIASDLPYAREVLNGYDGVTFVDKDDIAGWIKAIQATVKGKRYQSFSTDCNLSWNILNTIL